MRTVLIIILFMTTLAVSAYPSLSGICTTENGQVYFIDASHKGGTVWLINNEGDLIETLTHFNAYTLHLDEDILWIAGTSSDQGKENKHVLLALNITTGSTDNIISTSDPNQFNSICTAIGPNESVFFENQNRIFLYKPDGSQLHIDHVFGKVSSMFADKEGVLWIADSQVANGTLYRYKNNELTVFADQLMPDQPGAPLFKEKHLQGVTSITKDNHGDLYVCENAGCRILKMNRLGESSVFYQSPTLWSPMNVTFHESDAYILETGFNKVVKGPRVIKRSKWGAVSRMINIQHIPDTALSKGKDDHAFGLPIWLYFSIGAIIFSAIIIFSVKKQYNH